MECEKVREIVRGYAAGFYATGFAAERCIDKPLSVRDGSAQRHLLYMCEEMLTWDDSRKEKMMRWLGFIQGVLAMVERTPIAVLKETNKPDEST